VIIQEKRDCALDRLILGIIIIFRILVQTRYSHKNVALKERKEARMVQNKLLVSALAIGMLLVSMPVVAGGAQEAEEEEVTELTFANFIIGDTPGGRWYEMRYDMFEERYGDRYELTVEEVPGGEEYNEKLTLQISTGNMPDLYISENDTMGKAAYEEGLAIDMTPYADQIENFDEYYPQENIDKVKANFGEWVIWDVFAPRVSGYYYNQDLFSQVGVDGPPKTFDEFFELCEKLDEAGITPVGMMTGENGWTMQFWYEALVAAHSDEGLEMVSKSNVTEEFTSEPFRYASEQVKRILTEYANEDAIGASYEMVASQMFAEQLAMIANGPWMASDYGNPDVVGDASFREKIGYAPFPGTPPIAVGSSDNKGHGAMVTPSDENKELGAMLFWGLGLQPEIMEKAFEELGWYVSAYEYPQSVLDANPLVGQLNTLVNEWGAETVPWHYDVWTNAVMADGITRNMDLYAAGEITLDEYVQNIQEFADSVGKE
jgi:raffinose/stachyose/melibiose transport system substrate-binding protein